MIGQMIMIDLFRNDTEMYIQAIRITKISNYFYNQINKPDQVIWMVLECKNMSLASERTPLIAKYASKST